MPLSAAPCQQQQHKALRGPNIHPSIHPSPLSHYFSPLIWASSGHVVNDLALNRSIVSTMGRTMSVFGRTLAILWLPPPQFRPWREVVHDHEKFFYFHSFIHSFIHSSIPAYPPIRIQPHPLHLSLTQHSPPTHPPFTKKKKQPNKKKHKPW